MTGQRHLGLVAAAATLLAAAPLSAIFDTWTWLVQCLVVVALIAAAAAVARSLRAPVWAQLGAMTGALVLALTWMFPSNDEFLAILPSPATFAWFGELTTQAADEMRAYGVPVPDRTGLLFLTVLGIGAVAIMVDVLAVGLRRPALAGLPMLAIYSVPVAVYVDSVPATPFVVGAIGFLWLLVADNVERVRRFGRRFTGDGRDVDAWEPSPLASAGRRLTLVGVAAAVLLPVAVPGMTSGLLAEVTQSGVGGQGGTGIGSGSGQVNLFAALSGRLNDTATSEMVRVRTNEPEPFYLRFGVAGTLNRDGFSNDALDGRSVGQGLPNPERAEGAGISHRRYRAAVEVTDNFAMPMAPTYAVPTDIDDLDRSWAYDDDAQVVHSKRSLARGLKYEFDYVVTSYTPAALRRAPRLAPDDPLRIFTRTPEEPTVQAQVDDLIQGEDTDYDKVRAIYDFFSQGNGFRYELATESGTKGSEIASFLESKVGFCQQYAAAMAWMVRAADIPARVAFGFTRGQSPAKGQYVLTNRNLHAWTEVYFAGHGWVPFDATPASAVIGSARSDWAPDSDRVEPETPATGPSATPDAGAAGSETAPTTPRDAEDPEALGATGDTSTGPRWPWYTVAGGLVALLLLALPAVRRSLVRRRRGRSVPVAAGVPGTASPDGGVTGVPVVLTGSAAIRAREDAHAAWDELIDTMIDFRVPVDAAETPRLTAQRLATASELTGAAAHGAALLGRAEERARYAREPMQEERLGAALHEVRRALAGRAGRWVRISAALLPPSVLLRWRTAAARAVTRLAGASTRVTVGLSRWNPLTRWNPRRLLAQRSAR